MYVIHPILDTSEIDIQNHTWVHISDQASTADLKRSGCKSMSESKLISELINQSLLILRICQREIT